jgi:hypothetical protein
LASWVPVSSMIAMSWWSSAQSMPQKMVNPFLASLLVFVRRPVRDHAAC